MLPENLEFALHVHKVAANARRHSLYTVGVWYGCALHAVCHVEPIDRALASIRCLLEQDAMQESGLLVHSTAKPLVRPVSTLRRLRAVAVTFFAALLKPLR